MLRAACRIGMRCAGTGKDAAGYRLVATGTLLGRGSAGVAKPGAGEADSIWQQGVIGLRMVARESERTRARLSVRSGGRSDVLAETAAIAARG